MTPRVRRSRAGQPSFRSDPLTAPRVVRIVDTFPVVRSKGPLRPQQGRGRAPARALMSPPHIAGRLWLDTGEQRTPTRSCTRDPIMQAQNNLVLLDHCPVCGSHEQRPERIVKGSPLVRCGGCGLVFANPQVSAEGLAELYRSKGDPESQIEYYARHTTPDMLAGYDEKLARLSRLIGGMGRLLDVGCGAAYVVERAALAGWDASGVEVGEWARAAAERRGVRNVFIGDLTEMAFPDGHFDVVYCAQVLEHLQSPMDLLGEIHRILRPGGIFYADIPNYQTITILLNRDDWYMNHPPQHINYFTPATITGMLGRAGFSVRDLYTEGGLKLEVLLRGAGPGKAAQSQTRPQPEARPQAAASPSGAAAGPARPSRLKALAMPFVKRVLYDGVKVGVNICVFAAKPAPA